MGKKQPKRNTHANPALQQGLAQIAFSSAWGTHDNTPNRERTRQTKKRKAIEEYEGQTDDQQ